MKYSIETAEIRNHEYERDGYCQVIDETIYRGPFAFNVRELSPCSLSMSTTNEEERLPWASLSRPNRSRFFVFDLRAFDRKHVAQVQRVFFSFTRTPAGSKRRTRNNALRI